MIKFKVFTRMIVDIVGGGKLEKEIDKFISEHKILDIKGKCASGKEGIFCITIKYDELT